MPDLGIHPEINILAIAVNRDFILRCFLNPEHFAAAGDRTTVVVLNTDIDDKLREEGLYRELLHRVQNLRKELDVEYTQRIRLSIQGSERLQRIISANQAHLRAETLCVEIRHDEPGWDDAERREMKIEDEETTILLVPA